MYPGFIEAIQSMNKVQLTFYSKEDAAQLVRICAPMDYGPSRRARNRTDRYHFWDYDSDTASHTLSLLPDQIVKITVLPDQFQPSEFVTWNTTDSPWFVKRDWGTLS